MQVIHYRTEMFQMSKRIDLTGKRFGRLVVVKFTGKRRGTNALWKCVCDCGNTAIVVSSELQRGRTRSCGCLHREVAKKMSTKHGLWKHPLNKVWITIKQRCYNPNCAQYPYYGRRGIKVCDKWKDSFKAFYDWAINNGYKKGLTIDRIDDEGNYEPSNCQWITKSENTRRAHTGIKHNGDGTHALDIDND